MDNKKSNSIMRYIIILTVFVAFSSCNTGKSIVQQTKTDREIEVVDKSCPENYLYNRIPDCENAVKFMKAVIVPDTIRTKCVLGSRIGFINCSIAGDDNIQKSKDRYLFYINKACLENLDYKELFSIFCSKRDYDIIVEELNSERAKTRSYIFEGSISNMNGFAICIKNLEITGFNWDIHKIIE